MRTVIDRVSRRPSFAGVSFRLAETAAALLLIVAAGLGGGCGPVTGRDPGLTIGGRARLVSADGSDVILEFTGPATAKAGRGKRSVKPVKIETLAVPNGAEVSVLALDGDDVRIRLEGEPRPGLTVWVESAKLEPVRP